MKRRGLALGRRFATAAAAAVLALSLAGDRGRAATVPATVYGQDPLEVLELKVRPNVIMVLDTSGSMGDAAAAGSRTGSGDNPRARMYQAKAVLKNLVQQNQAKVSFQFLSYTQVGSTFLNQDARTSLSLNPLEHFNCGSCQNLRFRYQTQTAAAANLKVLGASGDTLTPGRGLQSWQIIRPEWNRLYFGESSPNVNCSVVVPGTPRFFNRGSDLATLLQNLMNGVAPNPAPTCTGGTRANTYRVTYNAADGRFTFARNTGSKNFNIRWMDANNALTPNSIRGALGLRAATSTPLSTVNVLSGAPYILLYRNTTGWIQGSEYNDRISFQYADQGITFYQAGAGRWFNGEVVRVQSDGSVCGMTFPTTAQTKNPPELTLQLVATGCGADTANQSAVFTWSGSAFGNNNKACRGGMSKVPLIPCDLPTAGTIQYTNAFPFLEPQIPLDDPGGTIGNGWPRNYTEAQDGSWQTASFQSSPSLKADGSTPIANTLVDIKGLADGSNSCLVISGTNPAQPCSDPTNQNCVLGACTERNFAKYWNTGQTASAGPPQAFPLDPIRNHVDPKERTIVVFVTDGDDTCYKRPPGIWPDGRDAGETALVLITNPSQPCPYPTDAWGNADSRCTGAPDWNALRAAYYAERLNTPFVAGDAASAVQTYVVGYGGSFVGTEPTRLNWIAWGGSGLGLGQPGQPDVATTGASCESWGNGTTGDTGGTKRTLSGTGQTGSCRWNATAAELTAQRALCTTCRDAFLAPDATTLAAQLQAIIDQGASEGDFNAQQSITESVFEYVDRASSATKSYSAMSPSSRYQAITPTRFVSSFSLPGFKGQLRAYQNDGFGNAVERWSAGGKLSTKVSTAMATCNSTAAGGGLGWCVINQLHGGATDSTIAGSSAKIQRRIYTTGRNGVYTFDPAKLMAGTSAERVTLWPPAAGVLPNDYSTPGLFDIEMGFPPNTPTAFPANSPDKFCNPAKPDLPKKSYDQCWFDTLQRDFKACLGNNLPADCSNASVNIRMRVARREAREIAVAFMAGAATIPEGTGVRRTSAAFGGASAQSLLYKSRSWILADSELATAAVVTQPNLNEPVGTPYVAEYQLFRDGPRDASTGKNPDSAGNQIRQGFGLTSPDDDNTVSSGSNDTRVNLKPVMTVVYAPANDMLHAFRAGPNCSPSSSSCTETGGEELWGFVPYDQLGAVRLRAANEPQGRDNHVYMLARGIRFADVFVPGAMTNVSIGGVTVPSMQGVWRRVLYFGRGIGGKYVTALDVTAPGPFTATALSTVGPLPLWSRGNPDTSNGLSTGGTDNGTSADRTAYGRMGETWSMPTVAYVNKDKSNPIYKTTRRPDGIDFAIFMGSGYGAAGEGTTHYALDALSGDVVAAVDIENTAASYGLTRTLCATDPTTGKPIETATCSAMPNALVANSVSFNRSAFAGVAAKVFNVNPHPWSSVSARVYVGDLHGRLWKFLTASPDVAIPAADLGATQPIGTAVALLAYGTDPATNAPMILVSAGADRRASGPFRSFSLRDNGPDTLSIPPTTGTVTNDGVTAFTPVEALFARDFDQGDPEANCGYTTEAVFRGTIQPAGAVECSVPLAGGSKCPGDLWERVFFGGTRLSLPNTKYAPPTPLSCGTGRYPCRSQFDSILYALGAITGQAAYDLNAGASDDAYRIFVDSRLAAITMQADPDPGRGGSSLTPDEGLIKDEPDPPPPDGVPPTATTATANVVFKREAGQPAPAVRYGSTVCQ